MGKSYSKKLSDPRWIELSELIKERDNHTCQWCGESDAVLNVHHKRYNGEPWEAYEHDLITVCDECHSLFHEYKDCLLEYLDDVFVMHDAYTVINGLGKSGMNSVCVLSYFEDPNKCIDSRLKKIIRTTKKKSKARFDEA